DAVAKSIFVPAVYLSDLMTKDWQQLERQIEEADSNTLQKYKQTFCKKALQLQLVDEGSKVAENAMHWSEKDHNWNVASADRRKFQWSYDSGDGLPFWYIPVEFLP